MKKKRVINNCFDCPLRIREPDSLSCGHPYWNIFEYNDPYSNMIIDRENVHYFPEKCPLKKEKLILEFTIKS